MDASSEDKTVEIANIYGARIYNSNKKTGVYSCMVEQKSQGEWFIFLHADSRLDINWLRKIRPVFLKRNIMFITLNLKLMIKK